MTQIVLFPSVLGIRPGIEDAVRRLRDAGHEVVVADVIDGRVSDEYEPAIAYSDGLGHEELVRRAAATVEGLPDDVAVMAWSLGCALATSVVLSRPVSKAVLVAGAIPPSMLGGTWPAGVPAQVHQTVADPWRDEGFAEKMAEELAAAGASCEVFEYPGDGHLFTDASLPGEYDADSAEKLWARVIPFLG